MSNAIKKSPTTLAYLLVMGSALLLAIYSEAARALGVLLFMILCDRTPFTASSASSLIRQVRDSQPPLPQEINPKVPAGLQAICLKALEREPELRYQSAGEMLADVERYISGETVVARPT